MIRLTSSVDLAMSSVRLYMCELVSTLLTKKLRAKQRNCSDRVAIAYKLTERSSCIKYSALDMTVNFILQRNIFI